MFRILLKQWLDFGFVFSKVAVDASWCFGNYRLIEPSQAFNLLFSNQPDLLTMFFVNIEFWTISINYLKYSA